MHELVEAVRRPPAVNSLSLLVCYWRVPWAFRLKLGGQTEHSECFRLSLPQRHGRFTGDHIRSVSCRAMPGSRSVTQTLFTQNEGLAVQGQAYLPHCGVISFVSVQLVLDQLSQQGIVLVFPDQRRKTEGKPPVHLNNMPRTSRQDASRAGEVGAFSILEFLP